MTPVFAMASVSTLPSAPFRPLVQVVAFDALLSVSSGPVAEAPVMPVARGESLSSPPIVQENRAAIVAVAEAEIDAAIRPLLAAFSGDAAPISVSVVSRTTANEEASASEVDSDEIQPTQYECSEMAVPVPGVIPLPIQLPAVAASAAASAALQTAPAIAKANQPPTVAAPKNGHPVMEPDAEIGANKEAIAVQTMTARQNIAPLLPQPTRDALLPMNQAGAIPAADLAVLLASIPVESNSVSGSGFQTIMVDRIADTAVRPLTDVSALVAERALDVARGGLWLDQLAGDIAAVQDKDRDLTFRLIPAQLGQLDVKIATSHHGMQLNFSTQSDEAARIIGSAQSRLVEELKAQGVRVAGSEVNAGSGQSSFGQQNGHPVRAETIAEFERRSPDFPEPTHASGPKTGRFA